MLGGSGTGINKVVFFLTKAGDAAHHVCPGADRAWFAAALSLLLLVSAMGTQRAGLIRFQEIASHSARP